MGNKKKVGTNKLSNKIETVVRNKKPVVATQGEPRRMSEKVDVVSTSNVKLSSNLALHAEAINDSVQFDIINIAQIESVLLMLQFVR